MKKYIPFLPLLVAFIAITSVAQNVDKMTFEKIQVVADAVRKQYIPDKRVQLWDVQFKVDGGRVVVKGATTDAGAKSALLNRLEKEGYQVADSLLLAPDNAGLMGLTYGIVNVSVCNMRVANDFSSEMTTQALLGMPVRILQKDGWYRIQTPDDYIAWVHRMQVCPMTKKAYDAWNRAEKIVVTSHYGFTYEKPDATSQTISDVVAGNRLIYEGSKSNFYKVSYPDGRQAYISKTISKPEKQWRAALKQDAGSIIRTAYTMMGIPYLWAGTSSKGVDCSGFVRNVLFMHDIIIPRDASQQAYVGKHIDIAPDFSNLLPGDLVFFGRKATSERKEGISHVGIYIGNKKFIHSLGDVHVGSFNPADREYDEYDLKRLLYASRILPYINKEKGLNTTDQNSYYKNTILQNNKNAR